MTDQPRILVLTRPGCHLCEVAVATIAEICAETGDAWTEQDITPDADLTRQYTDQVPVTFVDGAPHDYWRVDPARLRAALTGTTGTTGSARPRG
ncbi:MAG: glutaredoxin family protein [Propionibacteriaceae bacterium]